MVLDRERVERWVTTGESGQRDIASWVADTANQAHPLYPVLAKISTGLAEGNLWLRWVAATLRKVELQRDGARVQTAIAQIDAALAQLPVPIP